MLEIRGSLYSAKGGVYQRKPKGGVKGRCQGIVPKKRGGFNGSVSKGCQVRVKECQREGAKRCHKGRIQEAEGPSLTLSLPLYLSFHSL